jgi:hypothetical protein
MKALSISLFLLCSVLSHSQQFLPTPLEVSDAIAKNNMAFTFSFIDKFLAEQPTTRSKIILNKQKFYGLKRITDPGENKVLFFKSSTIPNTLSVDEISIEKDGVFFSYYLAVVRPIGNNICLIKNDTFGTVRYKVKYQKTLRSLEDNLTNLLSLMRRVYNTQDNQEQIVVIR